VRSAQALSIAQGGNAVSLEGLAVKYRYLLPEDWEATVPEYRFQMILHDNRKAWMCFAWPKMSEANLKALVISSSFGLKESVGHLSSQDPFTEKWCSVQPDGEFRLDPRAWLDRTPADITTSR
jgi:hypothetical protein